MHIKFLSQFMENLKTETCVHGRYLNILFTIDFMCVMCFLLFSALSVLCLQPSYR
jgi:hypothetical protein